jgi:predicted Zn-dependent protease
MDDPIVNAFALPGGFIYVTRGLLGHLRNEAELATVLGHEIGHVTAQHSVNQMSKSQVAQGGLIIGSILAPGVASQLASQGLGLLFLKYGRDDERQADDLGLRYMTGNGYDPGEVPGVFEVLKRVGELQGGGRIPGWLSSHPDPGARAERAAQALAEGKYPRGGEVGSEPYLRRTDGLVYGTDPRNGFFEGNRFHHPGLGFALEIPQGWAAANEASRVVAMHPEKIAQVDLRLAQGASPEESARAVLGPEGLEAGRSRSTRLNGLSVVETSFTLPREGTSIVGQANFVAHGGRVYQVTGIALSDRIDAVRDQVVGALGSFAADSRRDVEPQRIRVVRLDSPMTFEEFLRRHPSEEEREVLELINGIEDPARTLPAGTLVRRIEGRATGTQTIQPAGR